MSAVNSKFPTEISNPDARLLSKRPLSGGPNQWIDRFWFPTRLSPIHDLFRQDNSERVPEFADLEFDHS